MESGILMALSMSYVSDVMRQFETTVLVQAQEWPALMQAFKLDPSLPCCKLDRMLFQPVAGGFEGLRQRLEDLQAQKAFLEERVAHLDSQLDSLTKPVEVPS